MRRNIRGISKSATLYEAQQAAISAKAKRLNKVVGPYIAYIVEAKKPNVKDIDNVVDLNSHLYDCADELIQEFFVPDNTLRVNWNMGMTVIDILVNHLGCKDASRLSLVERALRTVELLSKKIMETNDAHTQTSTRKR